jgi:thiamine biosynthesis lipoprotein ApbE
VERQAAAMTRVAGWNGDPTVGPAMEPWRIKKKKKNPKISSLNSKQWKEIQSARR